MAAIGFLHTAEAHRATFRGLLAEVAPGARYVDAVDPGLLARARAGGITDEVRERVSAHLRALARDADAIVCTCSTVGGAAERAGAGLERPVVRIDRRVDVVVLAQASMAPVQALVADLDLCVLSSPRPAVERAVALAG